MPFDGRNLVENKTADNLCKAADLLEKNGWSPDVGFGNPEGPMCILGAVFRASGIEPHSEIAAEELFNKPYPEADALCRYLGVKEYFGSMHDADSIVRWNDYGAKDQQTVVNTLRACATMVRGGL